MNADPKNHDLEPDWETLWVLGQLSAPEQRVAEARLDADPALRTELTAQREALYTLLDDVESATVPAGAEDRLMARLQTQQRREAAPASAAQRTWRWPWALLGAATVVLVAALLNLPGAPTGTVMDYGDRPGAVSLPLRADGGEGAPLGTVVRLPSGEVYVQLDQAAPEGQVYQLWALRGEDVVSLGTFEQALALQLSASPGLSLAVSVEPPGGSPLPTSDPIAVLPL